MHDLRVPDLQDGIYVPPLGLVPIDNARPQLAQSIDGVGRSFIDVKPRAGLAIINSTLNPQATNAGAAMLTRGIVTSIPVRAYDPPPQGSVNT